jgi:hypothetical protein
VGAFASRRHVEQGAGELVGGGPGGHDTACAEADGDAAWPSNLRLGWCYSFPFPIEGRTGVGVTGVPGERWGTVGERGNGWSCLLLLPWLDQLVWGLDVPLQTFWQAGCEGMIGV